MLMNLKKNKYTLLLSMGLLFFTPIFSMFKNKKYAHIFSKLSAARDSSRKIFGSSEGLGSAVTALFVTTYGLPYCIGYGYDRYVHSSKDLFYITDIGDVELKTVTQVAQELQTDDNVKKIDLSKSQTYQQVYALAHEAVKAEYDSTTQLEQYKKIVDGLLLKYYSDIFLGGLFSVKLDQKSRERLVDTVVLFTLNEARYADTHYAFYTGSSGMVYSMLLRSMIYAEQSDKPMPNYFFMRTKSPREALMEIKDPKEHMLSMSKIKLETPSGFNPELALDQSPAAQGDFLSVNTSVMGNSLPYTFRGENSLAFITNAAYSDVLSQQLSGLFGSPFVLLLTDIYKACRSSDYYLSIDTDAYYLNKDRFQLSPMPYDYVKENKSKIKDLCKGHHRAALVQILVKKDSIKGCGYLSNPGGIPVEGQDLAEDLDCLQQGALTKNRSPEEIDAMQARLLLAPENFKNPESGNIMNLVLFGDKDRYKAALSEFRTIAKSVKIEADKQKALIKLT